MPLVNGLLFLVLILVGLVGYGVVHRFEKREAKLYLEWVEKQFDHDVTTEPVLRVHRFRREDGITVNGKKAG